ncbi:hypothetical protein HY030_04530 [Candidatus Gottesmanbacteria bacterium]|nr:hypothetical protein [Candidatus Gottesmanbacteria bacterium]
MAETEEKIFNKALDSIFTAEIVGRDGKPLDLETQVATKLELIKIFMKMDEFMSGKSESNDFNGRRR